MIWSRNKSKQIKEFLGSNQWPGGMMWGNLKQLLLPPRRGSSSDNCVSWRLSFLCLMMNDARHVVLFYFFFSYVLYNECMRWVSSCHRSRYSSFKLLFLHQPLVFFFDGKTNPKKTKQRSLSGYRKGWSRYWRDTSTFHLIPPFVMQCDGATQKNVLLWNSIMVAPYSISNEIQRVWDLAQRLDETWPQTTGEKRERTWERL